MSTAQMLLITKQRVELHPEFSASLITKWRAGQSLLHDRSQIAWRAKVFNDDGLEISDAIAAAKQQICADVVRSVCGQFWTHYRISNSLLDKAGGQ